MTDFRPDVYCNGCGVYVYSLPYRWKVDNFPTNIHCGECERQINAGVRRGRFLERLWQRASEQSLCRMKRTRRLSEKEEECVRSFARSVDSVLSEMSLRREKLTKEQWRAVGKEKLASYLAATHIPKTRRQISLLRMFVRS